MQKNILFDTGVTKIVCSMTIFALGLCWSCSKNNEQIVVNDPIQLINMDGFLPDRLNIGCQPIIKNGSVNRAQHILYLNQA